MSHVDSERLLFLSKANNKYDLDLGCRGRVSLNSCIRIGMSRSGHAGRGKSTLTNSTSIRDHSQAGSTQQRLQ